MTEPVTLTIHIDGAARGNPGPAAFAYVISQNGKLLAEHGECLGATTNNRAEYIALIRALERAADVGGRRLTVYSDSELLVKQMRGEYRVKNEDLRQLYSEAQGLVRRFDAVTLQHVRREQNARADRLCNEALDGEKPAPARKAPPAKTKKAAVAPPSVHEDAIICLQAAAIAWSHGDASDPSAESVWDQLWSILEDNGVVRTARSS